MKKLIFLLLLIGQCFYIQAQTIDVVNGTVYPGLTTTQRNTLGATLGANDKAIINNTTTGKLELWDGTAWVDFEASATGSDDQVASEVPFTPTGNTTSADVQAAIEEIQTELDVYPGGADWNTTLINIPADIADGDDDNQLSDAEVAVAAINEGFVTGAHTSIAGLATEAYVTTAISNVDEGVETSLNTTNFNGHLSATETDVQKALDVLDDITSGSGTFGGTISDNQVAIGNGTDILDGSADFTWDGADLNIVGDIISSGVRIDPTFTNFEGRLATGGVPSFGGSRLGDSDVQADSYDVGSTLNFIDDITPQQVNWSIFENNDVMTVRSSNNDIGVLDINGANGALYGTDDAEATIAQTLVYSDTKTYVNDLGVQRYEPGATDVGQSFFHIMANRNTAPRMKYYWAYYDGTTYDEIMRIDTDGTSLWAYDLEADSFTKTGATSDDVLLGDGTTTSLAGIGNTGTSSQFKMGDGSFIDFDNPGVSTARGGILSYDSLGDINMNEDVEINNNEQIWLTDSDGEPHKSILSHNGYYIESFGTLQNWNIGNKAGSISTVKDSTRIAIRPNNNWTSGVLEYDYDDLRWEIDGVEVTTSGGGVFLPLAGGTMTGDINLGTNNITNGGDITASSVTTSGLSIQGASSQQSGTTFAWNGINTITTTASNYFRFLPTDIESTPAEGMLYWDDSENTLKQYNGVAWEALNAGGGGDVTKVGTPVNNQIAIWTGDGTLEGETGLTWDGSFIETDDTVLSGIKMSNPTGTGQMWNNGNLHIKGEATNFGNTLISGTTTQFKLTEAGSTIVEVNSTGLDVTGNITVSGTVDGVDIATLASSNTGDQTSIVGITGTKAQFDTAVTDGDIVYVGEEVIEKTADYTSLAAISSPSTGDLVYVQADGIAGLFQYDAILSATDDGGIVKDGWVRQYHGDLNAKWWGVTGDGVTDDQPNISTALTYAVSNGIDIKFPKGDYLFVSEDDYYGVKCGWVHDGTYKNVRIYGESGTKFTTANTGATNGNFKLLAFFGNTAEITIEGIEFENTHGLTTNNLNAIYIQSSSGLKNMKILNNHFHGWTVAITVNGVNGSLIEGNRFTAPLGHDNARNDTTPAVYISLVSNATGENEDVIIKNNYVEGYSGTDITTTTSQKAMDGFVYIAANQGGSNGLVIEGNTLLNLSEEAIAVNSYLAWDAAAVLKPIIIRNNYIDSTFPVGTTQTTNYGILADAGNLHIYGNTIKAAYNIMVYPTTQTIQMSDISIHSNKIHLTDDTVGVLKGIFLQGYIASTLYPLNNVSVHDNDIFVKDLTLPADTKLIHIADIGNSIIKNNNFFIENVTLGGFDLDIYDFGGDSNNIEYGGETIIGSYTNLLVNNGGNTGINNIATGDIFKVGTPAQNQLGVWDGNGILRGQSELSFSGTTFNIGALANITVSRTGQFQRFMQGYSGGLGDDDYLQWRFGKSATTNNAAEIMYHHVGDGSVLNELILGFYGGSKPLTLTEDGNASFAGNIAVSGTVDGRDIAADGLVLDGLVSGGDGLGPDGDKGDITVGASGTTLTIDPSSVNSSKIADATIIEADMNISNAPVDEYVLTFESTGNVLAWQAETLGPDGDKGDITVSGNGTLLNIDNNSVGSNKIDLTDAYTWTGVHEFSSSIILTPTDIEPTGAEGTLYFDNSENTLKQHNGTAWEAVGGGGSADGLGPDGDKGDITVGGTGTTLTIDNDAVSNAKIATGAVTTGKIQDNTIIEGDLNADNTPNDGDVLTYDSAGTNFAWVAPSGPQADTPTTVLTLDNPHGRYSNMGTANTNTTFTTATSPVLGGWCKVRINAATQPTVTGATLVSGATFIASTDMYMVVSYNGSVEQYYFIKIAP